MFPTPKAFTNFSPWLLQPWEINEYGEYNAESVGEREPVSPTLSALNCHGVSGPGWPLRGNPGLKLADAFGVNPRT
jgi:hypothetical protein